MPGPPGHHHPALTERIPSHRFPRKFLEYGGGQLHGEVARFIPIRVELEPTREREEIAAL